MELTSTNVHDVFLYCLFQEEEERQNAVLVEGITINVGFHPFRLKEKLEDIRSLVSELPDIFMNDGGGGHTFLHLVTNKAGNVWANQQKAQELLLLGLASKLISYCMQREFWKLLPGGVPFIVVDKLGDKHSKKYTVTQFLEGSEEVQHKSLESEEAVEKLTVLARSGQTKRIIVTDDGDNSTFLEWVFGEGIVYPPEPMT